jgi:diguanylate cyclase (GGDEF)-like protein/PAS domain S-box-containing protein
VTSWNRRLSAASSRPAPGERTSRAEILAEALAAGVVDHDQSALMGLANVARDRPDFRQTLVVSAARGTGTVELEFEILYDPAGPLVRQIGGDTDGADQVVAERPDQGYRLDGGTSGSAAGRGISARVDRADRADRVATATGITARRSALGGRNDPDDTIPTAEGLDPGDAVTMGNEVGSDSVATKDDGLDRAEGDAEPGDADPGDADSGVATENADTPDITNILIDTLVETPDLVAIFVSVGHEAVWANEAFVSVFPIRESDKVWFIELLDEWSKGHYEVQVLPALVKYGRWCGRLTLVAGEDTSIAVSAVMVAHRDRRGDIEAVTLVARDMAEIKGISIAGSDVAAGSRFSALVENPSDVIAVLTSDGVVEYASPAAQRILQREDGALVGTNLLDLIDPTARPTNILSLARPDEQGIGAPVELRLRAADGSWRYLEVVVTDLTENSEIGGVVLNARDVTERVASVHALASRALRDVLTGLPGRVRLLDRMATVLQGTHASASVAVLLFDIDRVRNVNEHLGRDAGDELLQEVANRLRVGLAEGSFVGRLGSDEFVVLLPNGATAEAVQLANRLRESLSRPMELAGGLFDVTTSVGIAVGHAGQDQEPDTLLQDASRAVAQAKASGRDRVEVYTEEMAKLASRHRTATETLRHALDNDGVRVHYQPIVEIATDSVVAAEALLRVHDVEGAVLSPAEFIEAAESNGLISRLGSQVLRSTCEQVAVWAAMSDPVVPCQISVNISPRQLADPGLPAQVVEALNSAGVPPDSLWLEITESILIGAQPSIDASISYLRALGLRIGLDDFGAGQSSLGHLKRFPLDFVKIDRTLIAGLGINERDTAIVRATVELAHNLGLIVVAVGVENDQQLEYLQLLGCDRAQGYYFSTAVPPQDFPAVVSTRPHG